MENERWKIETTSVNKNLILETITDKYIGRGFKRHICIKCRDICKYELYEQLDTAKPNYGELTSTIECFNCGILYTHIWR